MRSICLLVVTLLALGTIAYDYSCPFASKHSSLSFKDVSVQEELQKQYFYWESRFTSLLGTDHSSGLAIDGQTLHVKTGQPEGNLDKYGSFELEAIHVALLAKVLAQDENMDLFYSEKEALELISRKLSTYEKVIDQVKNSKAIEIETEERTIKFSEEGGHKLYWVIFALNGALQERYPQKDNFLSRLMQVEQKLKDFVISYQFDDVQTEDDAYYWSYLLGFDNDKSQMTNLLKNEIEKFTYFKNLLQIHTQTPSEIPLNSQILKSIFNPNQVTPLFLLNKDAASAWLSYILSRPGGQSKYGSVSEESCNVENQLCTLTWESKITPVLSMAGGLGHLIGKRLNEYSFTQLSGIQDISTNLVQPDNEAPKFRDYFVSCRVNTFPSDFAFGTATASYQIEGAYNEDGKGWGMWDEFVRIPGRVVNNDTGDVADDFYHKYEEDIAYMKDLGLRQFRMSFSWPRLLPDGTIDNINWAGVAFYNDVIDKLLEAGIEPYVTLYHWDLPYALILNKQTDGWLNPAIQDLFNDYADFCFSIFGDRVKYWITFNEPQSFTWLGYGVGVFAPGRCSDYYSADCSWVGDGGDTTTEPYVTAHNVILAHAKAVRTYRQKYQKEQGGVIGMCTQSEYGLPWDPSSEDDYIAADTKMQYEFAWYNDPLVYGDYPEIMKVNSDGRLPEFTEEEKALVKGSFDFLGLNHYTSKFVHHTGQKGRDWGDDGQFFVSEYDANGELIGPYAGVSWLVVYPEGLRGILRWIDQRYGHLPIYVFENGCYPPNESDLPIEEAIHDDFRIDYYSGYIRNMELAMEEDGVDVRGYFAWSILDNFEWTNGYSIRFGLTYVDYDDGQKRYPKDSAYWYVDYIKQKRQ